MLYVFRTLEFSEDFLSVFPSLTQRYLAIRMGSLRLRYGFDDRTLLQFVTRNIFHMEALL